MHFAKPCSVGEFDVMAATNSIGLGWRWKMSELARLARWKVEPDWSRNMECATFYSSTIL